MNGLTKFLKLYGAPIVLCVVVAAALLTSWRGNASASAPRAFLAFGIAGLIIWFSHITFFPANRLAIATGNPNPVPGSGAATDPFGVRYAIAFDAIVFTLVGLAAAVAAAPRWETALLLSGTCLLIGAFFGLLFGYPQGVAQSVAQSTPPPRPTQTGQPTQTAQPAMLTQPGAPPLAMPTQTMQPGTPQKNLIAESASTLGKVLAGFTLAKAGPLVLHFHRICDTVAPALGQQAPDGGFVLAGAIILYFFATGFFSGLLLPSYFMSGKFG